MASDHLHVRTKFSNKSINHTVETGLIHTNTKTHHICLTYISVKAQYSKKKKMYTNKFFYMQTNIFFSFYVQLYTNNYYYFFKCLLIHFFFFTYCPHGGFPQPLGLWGLPEGQASPPPPSPPLPLASKSIHTYFFNFSYVTINI